MKTKRLSAKEARATFSDVLGSVYYRNEPVVIEKNGKPVAVVISPQMFEVVERDLKEAWESVQELRRLNADKDPEEVYAEVTAELAALRAEQRKAATTAGRS